MLAGSRLDRGRDSLGMEAVVKGTRAFSLIGIGKAKKSKPVCD